MISASEFIFLLRRIGHTYLSRGCFDIASALSFSIILSVAPACILMFQIVKSLPEFQFIVNELMRFIFSNLLPHSAKSVEQYLLQFIQQSDQLTALGSVFIVLAVVMMVYSIESAISRIWHTEYPRGVLVRIVSYSVIVCLGPILIGSSVALSYFLFAQVESVESIAVHLIPFTITALALSGLYTYAPRVHVRYKIAIIAASSAALLFELCKWIFNVYINYLSSYDVIYGALSVIPVFLLWVYISCSVVLFGAVTAFCLMEQND